MEAKPDRISILREKLAVGRGALKTGRQLHFAVADTRILELQTRHQRAAHYPTAPLVGLKVRIQQRTGSAEQQGPRAGELCPELAGSPVWSVKDLLSPASAIDAKPAGQLIITV